MVRRCAIAIVSAIVITGCGGSSGPSGPSAPALSDTLSQSAASAHIDYLFSEGDGVDAERQEAFHRWAVAELGIEVTRRLQYRKYRDRGHIGRVTGNLVDGFANPPDFIAHSIYRFDGHEAIHVYSGLLGRPSDFFNEGIAVAMAVDPLDNRFVPFWGSIPIDIIARDLLRVGQLPSLRDGVITSEVFRRGNDQVTYPVAGSFVGHLLRTHPMGAMHAFFRSSTRDDSVTTIEARFAAAFGVSLTSAEASWRAFLATQ